MKARSTLILLAALIAAMVAAGCGGSDDGSDTSNAAGSGGATSAESTQDAGSDGGGEADEPTITTSEMSKAAFVKKANAVCERAQALIFKDRSKGKQGSQEEEEELVITKGLVPGLESVADGLQELGAPAGDEAEVEAIAIAFQLAAAEIVEEESSSFARAETFLKQPSNLAKQYGLASCVFQ